MNLQDLLLLKSLIKQISSPRKHQFIMLLALMIVTSLTEAITIGALMPFLTILTNRNNLEDSQLLGPIIRVLGEPDHFRLLLIFSLLFGIAAILAALLRLLLLWFSTKLSYSIGAEFSQKIYRNSLYQRYSIHLMRNSNIVISGITSKTDTYIGVVNAVISFIASFIMLSIILVTLIILNPKIALLTFLGFSVIYLLIIFYTRKRLSSNSQIIAKESTQVLKILQEGLGGIRDVLIDGTQEVYTALFASSDKNLRNSQAVNQFIGASPRYAMEALGMILIICIALYVSAESGATAAIPIVGVLALGAQRMLPMLQQLYGAWAVYSGSKASLMESFEMLSQPLIVPNYNFGPNVNFDHQITLKNIYFSYGEYQSYVLKNLQLEIKKGDRLGIIGGTGSGKSTLLDILMGLLAPNSGSLIVDGLTIGDENVAKWQKKIAHVPQFIFLADNSIAENIAFGVQFIDIDMERVIESAKSAGIHDSIVAWDNGYRTIVGERGARLSGGQRQRIGIARALYKKAEIIILDEATSALDNETEEIVMESINALGLGLTFIIVAHRLTTLKGCSQIIELKDGVVLRNIGYETLVSTT